MNYYKFTSFSIANKIIEECAFRYSQPDALNDPLEFSIEFNIELTKVETLELFVNNATDEMILESWGSSLAATSEYERNILNKIPEKYLISEIRRQLNDPNSPLFRELLSKLDMDALKSGVLSNFKQILNENFGILSLSSSFGSELLWSHYADGHRGIVFSIDGDDEYFNSLIPVTYSNENPKIILSKENLDDIAERQLKPQFIKTIPWQYEEEVRDIKKLSDGTSTKITDSYGYPIYLFPFSPSIIKAVFFGHRVDEKQIIKFRQKILKLNSQIDFFLSSINQNNKEISLTKI